ncbi:lysine-specific demethylase 4C-like isoform X1 [Porites lutea]|uniref:lysine-specific demethylase 4C-like isoform X1 n=1 Tax=Porites lutea TaxID=51062 RepID=UPI003CC65B6F
MASQEGSKIMVFRPTLEEFANFSIYIRKMEEMGAHRAGVAKVIPPKEWIPRRSYEDVDITIPAPILQVVTGTQGLYQLFNVQKKEMSLSDFKELANSESHKPPTNDPDEIERKYWKNVTFNNPIYAADIPGTIFDKNVQEWNIGNLGTILDLIKQEYGVHIEGVNTPYLYFGMWKASFAWHTEDMDLYSINYLHFGAPKTWYAIPPEHGQRLERLAAGFFPGSFQSCSQFLRHKMTIISPQVLRKFSIPYDKITQEAGQFIITFPYGYHCGFNNGFNCAESTNFASERWIDYGKRAQVCTCKKDTVKICMDVFVKTYQPDQWEEYMKSKQKDNTDSDDDDDEEQQIEASEKRKEMTDKSRRKTKSKIIDLDDDMPLSKLKEALLAENRKFLLPGKSAASKRQPIVTKSFTLPSSAGRRKKMEETKPEKGHKRAELHSSRSNKSLVSTLSGLWHKQLPNFEMEQAFNVVFSQLGAHCSVCNYFSELEGPFQRDILTNLQEKLHQPLSSLIAGLADVTHATHSVPRVPEICFMSDDSSPESMSSWLDIMFTTDTASPLLRCEACQVLVHASCYGVSNIPSDGGWRCQRCSQQDHTAVQTSYCSLCTLGGGALKRTTDNRWAHVGCAVAVPEVIFVDVNLREAINTNQVSSARKKLKCYYCRSRLQSSGKDQGACVQCCAGKCAVSYHVTCFVMAGFGLEASDWPQPTETYCDRHQKSRTKGKQRDFSVIHSGESVVAKHKNGRFYHGVVRDTTSEEYYVVSFDDGTYCDNLPPSDIASHDSTGRDIPVGSKVQVKWGDDQDLFMARVTGRRISVTYQVEFEDDSWLNVRREDVYKANEELPIKVQQRLSSATERANLSYWDDIPEHNAKRPRKQNPRFLE